VLRWPAALLGDRVPDRHARTPADIRRARTSLPLAFTGGQRGVRLPAVLLGWALRYVEAASHASRHRARCCRWPRPLWVRWLMHASAAPLGFWVCSPLLGSALVAGYSGAALGAGAGLTIGLAWADAAAARALCCAAAVGYGFRRRKVTSQRMRCRTRVISWALVMAHCRSPCPASLLTWQPTAGRAARCRPGGRWAYTAVFSMWLGFFAWFRGIALGGALRVSQVQLLQPFLGIAVCRAAARRESAGHAVTLGFATGRGRHRFHRQENGAWHATAPAPRI
jgi:hypothetical protein